MNVAVRNPLLRTPLSLIIDDSCPVINKAYYWIQQRHEWRTRHHPGARPSGWEVHWDKLDRMPRRIPASFAREWGEWCAEEGIRGKFSLIPYPAGVARIDQGFTGFPTEEFREWMRVYREVIWPHFDLTPEMLTHTRVVDLATWNLTDAWEQVEWADPPVELLTDYIAAAMRLLRDAGFPCEGVTSPGGFGGRKEEAYARATLDAALRVNGNRRPFYFLRLTHEGLPDVPLRHVQREQGIAIASIVGCAGDWFGATGWDTADADLFIAEGLDGGRAWEVLEAERPCVLVGHWPCFYANDRVGFGVLREVKRRLDAYDPDGSRTIWMKNSEIGHYWMARELSDITVEERIPGWAAVVQITTRFPAANFTLWLDWVVERVAVNGREAHEVGSRRAFRSGTFLAADGCTHVAFDLPEGTTTVSVEGRR